LPFRARINVAIAVLALAKLFWAKANKIKIIAITALKGGAIESSPKMLNRDKKVEWCQRHWSLIAVMTQGQ
jgi:hypothetical protein